MKKMPFFVLLSVALCLTKVYAEPASSQSNVSAAADSILLQITTTDGELISYPVSKIDRMTFDAADPAASHEAVDLGLSVKWAACNVGAENPEDDGDYYIWGETKPQSTYDWSTYKWCYGSDTTLIKYCTDNSYGAVDKRTTLELSDDVAHVKWGDNWRMPTDNELNELINNCTWTWTTQNGKNGYKITSKTNGNSIFLPAAGCRNGSRLEDAGSLGCYWTSSLDASSPEYAYYLDFHSDDARMICSTRAFGQTVRPVTE